MLLDPFRAPCVVVIPAVGVEMEGSVVDGFDGEVGGEIDALVSRISVGTITQWRCKPSFVT